MANKKIKCVVVGDGNVGKTSLLISFTRNTFPKDCLPTIFENHITQMQLKNETYDLGLFDTAGNEGYENIRLLNYPGTDVFLLCFSVVCPDSFENVKEIWMPEIARFNRNIPFIIVGTKTDQRIDPNVIKGLIRNRQKVILPNDGMQLAKNLNAVKYVECSALTREGLNNVFEQTIMATFKPKNNSKRKCTIL